MSFAFSYCSGMNYCLLFVSVHCLQLSTVLVVQLKLVVGVPAVHEVVPSMVMSPHLLMHLPLSTDIPIGGTYSPPLEPAVAVTFFAPDVMVMLPQAPPEQTNSAEREQTPPCHTRAGCRVHQHSPCDHLSETCKQGNPR